MKRSVENPFCGAQDQDWQFFPDDEDYSIGYA